MKYQRIYKKKIIKLNWNIVLAIDAINYTLNPFDDIFHFIYFTIPE